MPRPPGDPRRWRLLIVLLLAVGFGAVAAFIASPAPSAHSGTPSYHPYHPTPAVIFVDLLAVGVPTVFAGWIIWLLTMRVRGQTMPMAYSAIIFVLVLLAMVVFLSVVGLLHQSAWPTQSSPGTPTAGTGNPGGPGVNSSCTNCTGGSPAPPIAFPTWALGTLAFSGLAIAGLIVLLYVLTFRRSPSAAGAEDPRDALRRELRRALQQFADSEPEDPRQIILALYARLLLHIQPRMAATEPLTPREIERTLVAHLGIRPVPAERLTRIFEEARYSSRPMSAEMVAETRAALGQVLEDLGGVIPAPLAAPLASGGP
ncbi:MAG TPA: DUF4129 domain-containing protein [Thermoplasmata archaeon]|nr:DUF4129 domain-containing protein [Thermoplasmata archaeon]